MFIYYFIHSKKFLLYPRAKIIRLFVECHYCKFEYKMSASFPNKMCMMPTKGNALMGTRFQIYI